MLDYLSTLLSLKDDAVKISIANFKDNYPNSDPNTLSEEDFMTNIVNPTLGILGGYNTSVINSLSNPSKMETGGVVDTGYPSKKVKLPETPATSINPMRTPLSPVASLPFYGSDNIPSISIVAQVETIPKYSLSKVILDKDNKLKVPSKLKDIANEYSSVLSTVTNNHDPNNEMINEYQRMDDLSNSFYTHPDNIAGKDTAYVDYANSLAAQLRDVYKTDVNVIKYDANDKDSDKVLSGMRNTSIIIPANNFTIPNNVQNTLLGDEINKWNLDYLLSLNESKKEIAKELTDQYSTRNNPLIKKDIQFDPTTYTSIQPNVPFLGAWDGEGITLSSYPNIYKKNDDSFKSTLYHEMSHTGDDKIFMNSNNYSIISKVVGKVNDPSLDYYKQPHEVQARINQIRSAANIIEKDRGTNNINNKLDKYIDKNVNMKAYKDLLKIMDKSSVIKLLNELAINSDKTNNTKNLS